MAAFASGLSVGWFSVFVMTALGGLPERHPVAEALDAVSIALDGVSDVPLWSLSDKAAEDLLRTVHRARSRFDELALRLIDDVTRRRTGERSGATSTRAWLRCELQMSPVEAKREIELAAALAGPLELTRVALAAGAISRAHAQVVVKVMGTLPPGLGDETLQKAERELLGWCRQFDPRDVARLGRKLFEVIDPNGAEAREAKLLAKQERDAKRRRHLTFGGDGFGLHLLRGQFDPESAAVIAAALDGLAKPLPSTADGPDPRSPGSGMPTPWSRSADDNWRPVTCRPGAGRNPSWCSPSAWTSCGARWGRGCWIPGPPCLPKSCGNWPATPR
jgi:Domain of unknown function (DUF222)